MNAWDHWRDCQWQGRTADNIDETSSDEDAIRYRKYNTSFYITNMMKETRVCKYSLLKQVTFTLDTISILRPNVIRVKRCGIHFHQFTCRSKGRVLFPCQITLAQHYWLEDVFLFVKVSHAILRTSEPNIGMFALILMHSPCWFKMWTQYFAILIFETFLKNEGMSELNNCKHAKGLKPGEPCSSWSDPGWSLREGIEAKIGRKWVNFAIFLPILEGVAPHAPFWIRHWVLCICPLFLWWSSSSYESRSPTCRNMMTLLFSRRRLQKDDWRYNIEALSFSVVSTTQHING